MRVSLPVQGETASSVVISGILLSQDGKWYQFNFPFVVTKSISLDTYWESTKSRGFLSNISKSFQICATDDALMYLLVSVENFGFAAVSNSFSGFLHNDQFWIKKSFFLLYFCFQWLFYFKNYETFLHFNF